MQIRKRQQGVALLAVVAAVSAIALTFVLGSAASLAKVALSEMSRRNALIVQKTAADVEAVYKARAAEIDGNATHQTWDNAGTMRAAARVSDVLPVRVLASVRQTSPTLTWRTFVVYYENEYALENPPDFDPATGAFEACPASVVDCPIAYAVVDGRRIQGELEARTRRQVEEAARLFQDYFRSRYLADPDRTMTINWFRSPFDPKSYSASQSCTSQPPDDLDCIDRWTPSASRTAEDKALVRLPFETNAWGLPIEVSNKEDSSYLNPPYSMAVRSYTPDGRVILVRAIQQP